MNPKGLLITILTNARNCLLSDEFLEEFRIPNHFVRKRKLDMRQMVFFLIFNSKKIIDTAMDDFMKEFPEVQFPEVTKQAISKGRAGIDPGLFKTLFSDAVAVYYKFAGSRKKWRDKYYLFAIDGSDTEVPASGSCFEAFGKKHDAKNPKRFWSQALLSVLYDIKGDIVVDAAIDRQDAYEGDLAMGHLAHLANLGLQHNAIVIFDRGYFNAGLYKECILTGCKCLMRIKSNSRLCKLAGNDTTTQIKAYDGTLMDIRVLKTTLSTGETEFLATNIFDEDITCDMFRELYFERWKIETKYDEAKERWEIEEFSGRTSLAVKQDIYLTLFFTNLAAIVKADADEQIQKDTKSTNKFKYQAKRTYIIGLETCLSGRYRAARPGCPG